MGNDRIQKVIQQLHDDFATYDIYTLISDLGITLVEDEQLVTLGYSLGNLITVRKGINEDIKEFVLAHELAHLMLHTNFQIPASFIGKYEKEANSFALLLLSQRYDISTEIIRLRLNEYYGLGV